MSGIIYTQERLSRKVSYDISSSIVEAYAKNIARDASYFSWRIFALQRLIKKFGPNKLIDGFVSLGVILARNRRQLIATRAELVLRTAEVDAIFYEIGKL